jgi:hypothetical protein
MQFSALQIAQLVNGKLEGDSNAEVESFGKIEGSKERSAYFFCQS